MTQQESFKRRIRKRMAKTGERYNAARRALLAQAPPPGRSRTWVSEPEMSDDAVREATGRGWDEWCDLLDQRPDSIDGHTAIAAYVLETYDEVDAWWAQTVTVGYERITGLRLPYERPDGTFTAGKTRTLDLNATLLRHTLLDADGRAALFPGHATELRSKPTSKAIRISLGGGTAQISLETNDDGRCRVAVQHTKLATYDAVQEWKFFWDEWFDALANEDRPA